MGIADVARGLDGGLSEAGRRALELLLADPAGMSKLSAAQVAGQVGVHETTLTRLATRLGFPGYRQSRAALAREGSDPVSSADRMRTRGADDYTFASLITDEVAALERAARIVDQQDIDDLAEAILASRTVYLFGPPYAQQVNALLARRLRRLGIRAEVLPSSGRLIAEHLTAFTGDDMLISFVLRRPDPRVARMRKRAVRARPSSRIPRGTHMTRGRITSSSRLAVRGHSNGR